MHRNGDSGSLIRQDGGVRQRPGVTTIKTCAIAAILGDSIGPKVVDASVEVLDTVAKRDGGFAIPVDRLDWGGDY